MKLLALVSAFAALGAFGACTSFVAQQQTLGDAGPAQSSGSPATSTPAGDDDEPAVDASATTQDAPFDASDAETRVIDAGVGSITVAKTSSCTWLVTVDGTVTNLDVWAELGSPTCVATVTLVVAAGAVIDSATPVSTALRLRDFADGSTVDLVNHGLVVGAGGSGGSGGNGGSGGSPRYCGRDGGNGGNAITTTVKLHVSGEGSIYGGGGGGGGASGGNHTMGGGGGAGQLPGGGGAGATTLDPGDEQAFCGQDNDFRTGTAGNPGTTLTGGSGIDAGNGNCISGGGGGYGQPGVRSNCLGQASGGLPGHAIEVRSGGNCNVAPGSYDTGSGPVRGPVGPPD